MFPANNYVEADKPSDSFSDAVMDSHLHCRVALQEEGDNLILEVGKGSWIGKLGGEAFVVITSMILPATAVVYVMLGTETILVSANAVTQKNLPAKVDAFVVEVLRMKATAD